MKNIFRKIGLLVIAFGMASCNAWLEVEPETDIAEDEMYKNTKGFYSVLNGIYYNIGEPELYGRHLSWGAMDAWAGVYTLTDNVDEHKGFIAMRDFNYDTKEVRSVGSSIWENGYRGIARANNLIEHIEQQDSTFFDNGQLEKNVLMGEALALRAFIHFDMLRVFAQAPLLDATGSYIPYVTQYPMIFNPAIPTNEVLEKIVKDLKMSKDLLATFDTLQGNKTFITNTEMRLTKSTMPDWGKFYAFRGTRLNYYAVTGLLARVYLYAGQYDLAMKQALEIVHLVENGTLRLTEGNNIASDPKMMDGVLFCLNYSKMVEGYANYSSGERATLYVEDPALFDPGEAADDYDKREDLLDHNIVVKYMEDRGKEAYTGYVPLIRLSEICYIAAECYLYVEDVEHAVQVLNMVRKARGGKALQVDLAAGVVMDKLVNDARKDLISEGQILFMFKRLNKIYTSKGKVDAKGKLVLPKPTSESAI
ncbi:RagB/SusD family nutrient uptake outer membrane protein [Butyricimonas synergistica]|uniref:RagB/SusD family nutrient uptake outer membrane protein n=1 Tax=Butyricimonas synergistica TaxID=544644 RepID=UPI0003822B9D|nr:RagB/SusD family nutrient uptake outer membrane protein [Butyricimonas synergistica]